jgi:hypothetical protein
MVHHASFPFKTRGGVAARSSRELTAMLRDLASENGKTTRLGGVNLQSAAGIRSILGGIPPSFGDGTGLLFAIGRVGGDTVRPGPGPPAAQLEGHGHDPGLSGDRGLPELADRAALVVVAEDVAVVLAGLGHAYGAGLTEAHAVAEAAAAKRGDARPRP